MHLGIHNDMRLQRDCLNLILKYGWTSVQVEDYKHIPASTIRNWKAHYQMFGRTPAQSRRDRAKLGPRVLNRTFTPALKASLKQIVQLKPWQYLDEYQQQLFEQTGVRVSTSAIYKVLTEEFNWSLQTAEESAKERNEIERAEHLATLHEITGNPKQFVFVDETSKSQCGSFRRRLWSEVNHRPTISRYFSDFAQNSYTMIGACDMDGFIPEACELIRRRKGNNDLDEEAGTVDGERFVQWIEQKLVPTLGNYWFGEPRSIVVMDNASIHSDPRVFQLISQAGALLVYQSAYSPDYDPIEFAFHQYKAWLRRHGRDYGANFNLAHLHALDAVQPHNMRAYYRTTGAIRNVPAEPQVVQEEDKVCLAAACATVLNNNSTLFDLLYA